jgi:hypothetical protein
MQVLTLIDSLIAAGAERMAVNIANGLGARGLKVICVPQGLADRWKSL